MIGFVFLCYAIFMTWLILSKAPKKSAALATSSKSISIVVAYRNEEENLPKLISDFEKQANIENIEIILVNDHSEDGGLLWVESLSSRSQLNIVSLNLTENRGKKAAMVYGVVKASNEIILCTDADCRVGEKWVECMAQSFRNPEVKMILGPVELSAKSEIFQHLQQIEFSSLMAITLLTTRRNRPILSNGANVAFRKDSFIESNAYEGNENVQTGDDVFLLHKFKQKYGNTSILFIEEEQAQVTTKVIQNLNDFFSQRIRWASKSKNYKDADTIKMGAILFVANFSLMFIVLGVVFQLYNFQFLLGVFLFKWVLDLILLQQLPLFMRPKNLVKWSLLLSICYPFYSVGIALLSLFYRPQWKGRKI